MFLARHTICSSGNARSISAVTPSGARLALFQPGQTLPDITWRDFNLLGPIVQRSPPFQNTFVFGLQLQLAPSRNSDLKNVNVETSDGRRRRFLPQNSWPIEKIATFLLHWRAFRLAFFPQKNHSSLSSKSPSSPPQETIAPSPFNSRRSTLQLRLQIEDDLILLALFVVSCAHLQCAPRNQEKPTGHASRHQTLQSHQQLSPMQRDHSLSNEERREFVSSCLYQKHRRCGLSDTCQPLPDDPCHTPAMSRPKHPVASFPLKRTSNPPETPCSRAAIQLLSRNPTKTTCCPRGARNSV